MNYSPLFTISIEHEFYSNKKSPDFRLVPSAESWRLLKKYRLLWREKLSSWQVITPLDENGEPFLPFEVGTTLRFFLKLANPKVIQFTQFQDGPAIEDIFKGYAFLRFFNSDDVELKSETYFPLREDAFEVLNPSSEENFFLKGPAVPGLSETDFSIKGLSAQYPDAYVEEEKKLGIDTQGQPIETLFTVEYRAVPSWSRGVFGVIDIEEKAPLATAKKYGINLKQRTVYWQYYVVSDVPYDSLELAEVSGKIGFNKKDLLDPPPEDPGEEEPNEHEKVVDWLKKKFPGAPTLALFESKNEEAICQELSIDLQLKKGANIIQSHLPIPSRENSEIQIIKYFS